MATYAEAVTPQERGQIRGASGINLAIGIWLIIAPFVLATTGAALVNDVAVGIVIAALAAVRIARPAAATKPASWVNAVLGAWLIVAPFALGYISQAAFWNDILVGVAVLVFALWSASQPRTVATTGATTTGATSSPRAAGVSGNPEGRKGADRPR